MKTKLIKGGRVQIVDPHAHVIEHILHEDQALEKNHQKEKQERQPIIVQTHPKTKAEEIDLTPPSDKIKILEKDKAKVKVLQDVYIKFNMPGINKLYDLIRITHL